MYYGIQLTRAETGFRLSCRDFPGLVSEFPAEEEARDFLPFFVPTCLMSGYRKKRLAFPLPSEPQKGEELAYIPPRMQAKILFWNYLVDHGLKQAEVARRLGVPQTVVARMADLHGGDAGIDKIDDALRHLGARLSLTVVSDGVEHVDS